MNDLFFMPIGGGDEVGASCYYLNLNDVKLLLDCGIRYETAMFPRLDYLVHNQYIHHFSEINALIISHAHMDHYGAMAYAFDKGVKRMIATTATKTGMQKRFAQPTFNEQLSYMDNDLYITFKHAVDRVSPMEYYASFFCGDAEIKFLPAGHIRGAAITLIYYNQKKIIYTGDFLLPLRDAVGYCDEELTYDLMQNCDVLIMENTYGYRRKTAGTNSKHAQFDDLMQFIERVYPAQLFLIHSDYKSHHCQDIGRQLEDIFPSVRVTYVSNLKKYDLEDLL